METKLTWNEYISLDSIITEYINKLTFEHVKIGPRLTRYGQIAGRTLDISSVYVYSMQIQFIDEPKKELLKDILSELDIHSFISKNRNKDLREHPEYKQEILDAYKKIEKKQYESEYELRHSK